MARIDDYKNALELGKKDMKGKDPIRIGDQSGAAFQAGAEDRSVLTLDFLNRKVALSWPALTFSFEGSDEEVPIQQQVLLLHYLNGSKGSRVTGQWIAYQEVPDGRFYLDAFLRRAKIPMVQGFGNQPELLVKLATDVYDARPLDQGDISVVVQALPMVPV